MPLEVDEELGVGVLERFPACLPFVYKAVVTELPQSYYKSIKNVIISQDNPIPNYLLTRFIL